MSPSKVRSPFVNPRSVGPIAIALLALVVVSSPGRAWSAQPVATHRPPVDAPVTDPFRPPDSPYAAGTRVLEYVTREGDALVASAAGTVVFAGRVGSTTAVTIRHDRRLRTTYTHLVEVLVAEGDTVRRGQLIARARTGFHFGARLDGTYIDPATLFGEPVIVVRLVPVPRPLRPGP